MAQQKVKKFKYMTEKGLSDEVYFGIDAVNVDLASGKTLEEFTTELNNDFTKYYLKTETYSREEVNDLLSKLSKLKLKKVDSLPLTDIDDNCIYLVPNNKTEGENIFDEYIYVDNKWEIIGTTKTDLDNYYTKAEIDNKKFISNAGTETGKIVLGTSTDNVDEISAVTADGAKKVAFQEDLDTILVDATDTKHGLMSSADKGKLDKINATTTIPKINGVAVAGTEDSYARGDHVHPEQVNISGNAATAHKLLVAKDIELTGGVTGSVSFDGSQNVSIATTLANASDTIVGGIKMRYDEETETLYMTNDGTTP